mmetsp:Transcript_25916/g.46034  ORF Transcript_25916/g.46034 Transcript_25916/m.46034 type:complete len:229 (-) Transcript_25916:188-874(-)
MFNNEQFTNGFHVIRVIRHVQQTHQLFELGVFSQVFRSSVVLFFFQFEDMFPESFGAPKKIFIILTVEVFTIERLLHFIQTGIKLPASADVPVVVLALFSSLPVFDIECVAGVEFFFLIFCLSLRFEFDVVFVLLEVCFFQIHSLSAIHCFQSHLLRSKFPRHSIMYHRVIVIIQHALLKVQHKISLARPFWFGLICFAHSFKVADNVISRCIHRPNVATFPFFRVTL